MVRADRPWQLAARLSRALIAAGAAGIFALVTSDVWRLAGAFGWQRLTGVTAGSVAAIGATLIVGARLWERVDRPAVRQQVVLFNVATTATIVIGVVALYAVLFVLALLAGLLLIVPEPAGRCARPPRRLPRLRRGGLAQLLPGHCRWRARRRSGDRRGRPARRLHLPHQHGHRARGRLRSPPGRRCRVARPGRRLGFVPRADHRARWSSGHGTAAGRRPGGRAPQPRGGRRPRLRTPISHSGAPASAATAPSRAAVSAVRARRRGPRESPARRACAGTSALPGSAR